MSIYLSVGHERETSKRAEPWTSSDSTRCPWLSRSKCCLELTRMSPRNHALDGGVSISPREGAVFSGHVPDIPCTNGRVTLLRPPDASMLSCQLVNQTAWSMASSYLLILKSELLCFKNNNNYNYFCPSYATNASYLAKCAPLSRTVHGKQGM